MTIKIPETVQDAVDQYMELYQVSRQLEERMQAMRKIIEPFLRESGLDSIRDRNRTGKLTLTLQERAKMTSRYTTYDLDELSAVLDKELLKQCLVQVVDRDKVEALSKLGALPGDVVLQKSTTPTYSLGVRFEK